MRKAKIFFEWTVPFIFASIFIGAQWYTFGKYMGKREMAAWWVKNFVNKED